MVCPACGIGNDEGARVCRACGTALFAGTPRDVTYAGFWKRAVAAILDSLVLFAAGMALGIAYAAATGSDEVPDSMAANVVSAIVGWLYFALMESSARQATLGKSAMGIIVTDLEGRRISFYRATGRHFGKLVSSITLGFGFAMAGFTEKKQALHDKMFDCLVVNRE